jgi:hypothetical protein
MLSKIILLVLVCFIAGCDLFSDPRPDGGVQKMDTVTNYKRDLILQVNGVTKEGSISMKLLPKNIIHVWSPNDMDTFVVEACGGDQDKKKEWAIPIEVRTGFFGWGKKKIDSPREAQFTIDATDFHDVGVCPLYIYAISKSDGKKSEGFVTWQTEFYKATGYLVCNMEKREFEGVEACSTKAGSFTIVQFDEEMYVSPSPGCEINNVIRDASGRVTGVKENVTSGKRFDFQTHSGTCNYEFLSKNKDSDVHANYNVYGHDEIPVR